MLTGFVIADDKEFSPVERLCKKLGGTEFNIFGDKALRFKLENGEEIVALLCGIGKVNAAAGTAALIMNEKPDRIINFGLSGAISGVYKNDIVVGTKYIEHDFDLTSLGYEIGQKPQDVSHFSADEHLLNLFIQKNKHIKPCVFVTGDMFVSSNDKKEFIIKKFNGGCCDMESAAIAGVCYKAKIPFISIRVLSDDADENAGDSYHEVNSLEEYTLVMTVISTIS